MTDQPRAVSARGPAKGMSQVLPRKAVRRSTWSTILEQLELRRATESP